MVHVTSEIGRLRKVLVHAPGPEVERMTPAMMEELLFDDILYGAQAKEEHGVFTAVLDRLGIGWLDTKQLLIETLENDAAREWLYSGLFENTSTHVRAAMVQATAAQMAEVLIGGLRTDPDNPDLDHSELFQIPPVPNWCFQRDPNFVVGDGIVFSAMATPARWREVLLSRTIFRFHPEYRDTPVHYDPITPSADRPILLGLRRPSFEGGDFLVLSKDVVAVGYSERTNSTGIRSVARSLAAKARRGEGPRYLLVVHLPQTRAYMHLDTLMTAVDRDACLVFPPALELHVHEIDLCEADIHPTPRPSILEALALRGIEYEPIPCGGPDPLDQQREQWTDGANAFALAPGVIALYDRNVRTAEELSRRGFRVIDAEDLIDDDNGIDLNLDAPKRTCILVPSHELSRARGGPHCLTQPLIRDDLD
ncbi:MAG: hypothetical protein KDA27_07170 [Candidatus Eisenbacteria bacterium]|uniref:Arginine deiminase n=1 Tax=Eiseniibacteriota bacterium TaxID=2212470 RepID=A0A956NDQ3_UNCEI|nr:hypothetical protein [Candidatus Eisenbacteria bacterium]MCB9465554.1 hypothetical protein [Candidatus Eisenbacteria bacterium]